MNLLDILDLDLIDLDMDATDKDGVLKQLSSMLYKKGNIKDLDKFLEAVYERESIGETGLGGIAIPHGLTDQVINASVAIGKVKQPVEWESLDDQPVSLIFLLAAPTGDLQKTHLQNLSQLASVVAHKAHVDATEVRKSELSRATLSFFPKTKCPIFAYPNDSTAKSTIEPPFRMLSFIKNLYIFSILIICIILDLVYGSATSFIHCILYSFTSKSDYLASCHIDHCHMKDIGQVIPPPEASITHPRSSLRYEIYQSAQFPHT